MTNFIVLLSAISLFGCSYTTYKNGPVSVSRFAIGSDIAASGISDSANKNGHSIKFGGYNVNQSEALAKAFKAGLEAAMMP